MSLRRIIAGAAIGTALAVSTAVSPAQAATDAAAACGGAGTDRVGGSYVEVRSDCSVVGGPSTKVTYEVFGDRRFTNQRAVVEVYGIENGRPKWYSLGTVAPGPSVYKTVPWGNNAANPKIRITASAAGGALVAKISFNH
ncbi:hypothetical protein GCM10022243_37340 [Saccharothrix violaceirubra]|uniref:Putative membrane protein n=1 Tax=Saccharothrix violaceirubra TaxID=413306 RepID=A0A7W7WWH3_9PSEU|nr:hypothetical protein [Saccharothrix violaceirubra]MBB4966350.1 putative membrane protein [Saccharothrix violaceirubra]